jgi:hypothetical protein
MEIYNSTKEQSEYSIVIIPNLKEQKSEKMIQELDQIEYITVRNDRYIYR